MIHHAVYIAIGLHFSRKLLMKLQGEHKQDYRETIRRLRELPPDEMVVMYEKGRNEPLKLTARSACNYLYGKMLGLSTFPI